MGLLNTDARKTRTYTLFSSSVFANSFLLLGDGTTLCVSSYILQKTVHLSQSRIQMLPCIGWAKVGPTFVVFLLGVALQ